MSIFLYENKQIKRRGCPMKNYLDVQNGYQESDLAKIATIIKNGGLVLFPTETVYGIGTNGLDEKAVKKLYEAKKRDIKNPINLLVSSMEMVKEIAQNISLIEYKLMQAFFPGPFTIILKRKKIVPNIVTANSDLVGVRMSDSSIAKKLVALAGVPIAAPSANISGKLSGTNLADSIYEFSDYLDFTINGGDCEIGLESTIVRVIDGIPHILRPGAITLEQIKSIAGNVVLEENANEILPSSHLNHYQLESNSVLVYSQDNQKMIDQIIHLSKNYHHVTVVCCTENAKLYKAQDSIQNVIAIASKNNLKEYSKYLFSSLRKTSSLSSDIIFIEGVKKDDLGIAIMNRLLNVCQDNLIEI